MGGHNSQQAAGAISGSLLGVPTGIIGSNPKMIGMKQDQFNQDALGMGLGGLSGVGASEYMRQNKNQNQQPQVGITPDQLSQLRQMGFIQ
jgi:hypothetical protein